jgi:tetratricopeptide (TPR) repeat protein
MRKIGLILLNSLFIFPMYAQVHTLNDYYTIKSYCTQKIKEDPQNYYYYKARADAEYFLKEFNNAVIDYSSAISKKDNDAYLFYNRGIVYYNMNDYTNATNDFTKSLLLKSKMPEVYLYLGLISEQKANISKAIEYYTNAITDSINFNDAYYNRGLCYSETNEFESAVNDFCYIYRSNQNTNTSINLAYNYAKLKKFTEAEKILKKALKKDSKNSTIYKYYGLFYLEKELKEKACAYFDQAKKMGEPDMDKLLKTKCE